MCWTHTHMWCLAYLNFLWRTEVSYLEKQRDEMVSVCDWVNTQCLGMRINCHLHANVLFFVFFTAMFSKASPDWFVISWMPRSAHLCHSRFGDQNPTLFQSGRSPMSQDRLTHVQPLFTCKGFKRSDKQKKEATRISGRPCSLGEQHKISNSYTARIARCVPHTRI